MAIPLHMDYDGQMRAEWYSRVIIMVTGILGFIYGYIEQQFSYTVYILGAGCILAGILTLPPWPLYRRKPLKWQKPKIAVEVTKDQSTDKQKKKK